MYPTSSPSPKTLPWQGLLEHAENPAFQKRWAAVKQSNKERLAKHVEATLGFRINTRAMFDVQIKVRSARLLDQLREREADDDLACSVCTSTRYARSRRNIARALIHQGLRTASNPEHHGCDSRMFASDLWPWDTL